MHTEMLASLISLLWSCTLSLVRCCNSPIYSTQWTDFIVFHSPATNLSVDADVEEDKEDEGDDAVDEEVEIDQVNLDIEGVKSEGGWPNIFNLNRSTIKRTVIRISNK